jgi:hypothetical protein
MWRLNSRALPAAFRSISLDRSGSKRAPARRQPSEHTLSGRTEEITDRAANMVKLNLP